MALLDIRQRVGWLFMTVTVAHLILISAQVQTRRGVPMLEEAVFGTMAEVQRVATGGIGEARGFWQNYVNLRQIGQENETLKQRVSQLEVALQRERALAGQSRLLQDLLDLKKETGLATTPAAVIASGASPEFRTMTLDKGSSQGLGADMAVIAPAGIVGRVILPTPRAAKVQLITDRNAAVAGLVERTRDQGVAVGTGGDRLRFEYVSGTADLKAGDRVVTSGIDGIYPKGFVIGQIESIERSAGEFSNVLIRPAVDLSALEAVLVVTSPTEVPKADSADALAAPEPARPE
ncbi:MAG TPA: rod shape-determining protein MreC [Vicinamibacterales bacterium]|jgi:rod shape-determining protein MreC|nr:rod shape-determining protein MreC [Vicinamibacterales bacterium]